MSELRAQVIQAAIAAVEANALAPASSVVYWHEAVAVKSAEIALLAVRAQMEWQPIEAAPKDGRYILFQCDWGVGPRIVVGWWDDLAEGWFATPCVKGLKALSPICWMPLPPPPGSPSILDTALAALRREQK